MQKQHKINNIVVVGGGSAGWLTALSVHAYQPHKNIVLIESDDIGILGAGEGTIPHFTEAMLNILNIDFTDLINNTNGTVKNSIKFTGWNKSNLDFHHTFNAHGPLSYNSYNDKQDQTSLLLSHLYANNDNIINKEVISSLSEETKIPILKDNLERFAPFAVHFDAQLLAKYLRTLAIERGITRVEGIITSYDEDNSGDIINVKLKDGQNIPCDFIFDCSGLHRQIIGKHYNSEWISYKDSLPVNRALPFFIKTDSDHNLHPYTEAIAMKYGWVWKIPVQGRYGCGYVFDSNYLTDDQALQEVKELFGKDITSPRQFSFEAGRYKEVWKNNCIAIGLSQGFIEPLEATSIYVSCASLITALSNFYKLEKRDQLFIDEYNNIFAKRMQEILDFIYFHYITDRTDTDFWKHFTIKNKIPDSLKEKLSSWQKRLPIESDLNHKAIFGLHSWLMIGTGNNFISNDRYQQEIFDYNNYNINIEEYNERKERVVNDSILHKDFLNLIKK